jgi:hypothetical protein
MPKIITILLGLCLTILIAGPVLGQPPIQQPSYDRKINELSNQIAALDSTWGRFQIGGNFELDTTSTLSKSSTTLPPPGVNQQLGLNLDTAIDQNLQLSVRVIQSGDWGLKYKDDSLSNAPITTPFQVNEAFLKLTYPDSIDYLGRFRFTLGPLGLISDFYTNPVEGVAIQKAFHNYHVIGIYSRVLTQYTAATNEIQYTTDYLAARVGWSNESTIIGLNMVPGLSGEKAFSLDWSLSLPKSKWAAEVGCYSFQSRSELFPDYKVNWTPGILISYGRSLSPASYLQIKAGYLGNKFQPLYSSLADSSGDDREWFVSNSRGVELYLQNNFKHNYGLENRLILLTPQVINDNQLDFNYRWRSAFVKHFSPINMLQVGMDLKSFTGSEYNQLFATWTLQF